MSRKDVFTSLNSSKMRWSPFLLGLVFLFFWGFSCVQAQGVLSVIKGFPQEDALPKKRDFFPPKLFPENLTKETPADRVFSPKDTAYKKAASQKGRKIVSQEEKESDFEKLSPLEKLFRERAKVYGISLKQFGYDFFSKQGELPTASLTDFRRYVLGPGDELFLYIIGAPPGLNLPSFLQLSVDQEGKIYLPGLGVFYLWGRTLPEAEKFLSNQLKANLRLSLGRLRHFPVYVSGEVWQPGMVPASALDTVIEVLARAGGVKKTGSLRKLILTRAASSSRHQLDLYQLLLYGKPLKVRVRDGDVVLIPPLEHAAAVGGEVRRPGIYEFLPGQTLADLIKLAGGLLPSSYRYRVILERYEENRSLKVQELPLDLAALDKISLQDGDLLVIKKVRPEPENSLRVAGHTPYPGLYEYHPGLSLKTFLTLDFFYRDTSLTTALLERHPRGAPPRFITFSPQEVLTGSFDLPLAPGDVIRLFPEEFYRPVRLVGCIEAGYVPYQRGLTLKMALADKKFCGEVKKLKAEIYRQSQKGLERVETVYLAQLLIKNQKNVDISLKAGDLILIRKISPEEIVESVTIAGYVKKPGTYALRPGMRLYDLLKEAGGFRPKAYPLGIVLLRESVAAMQRQRLNRALIELQKALAKEEAGILQAELSPAEKEARRQAFSARRHLLAAMEKTEVTGRLTGLKIPLDLEKLKDSPSNILLEDGDQIFVPKEPASVLIFGEVNNPSAVLYEKGLRVEDYITRAGGFTKHADVKEIFVIRANGEAIAGDTGQVESIFWDAKAKRFVRGSYGKLLAYEPRPGEAIIVPTKIKVPIMWRPLIRDVIQIIYQSALTVFTITNL